ncbi:SDR family NAD(P)-dependent oxidoreductase [Nocardia brevicatena]|uniref:SDR family NAD(P)-dependent oxidoreductase n=1 Tax=Nocardia brevicatena TaxID=37327 RepID=UPI0002FB4EFC|nr:SDR family oxidoreductase [Nocardia brevicatena]
MTSGRNVLITGGGNGIGAATARLLAADGCDVWLTYATNEVAVRRVESECGAHGVRTMRSAVDLGDPGDIRRLADDIGDRWGSLHVVVNNAGSCPYTPWQDITATEWDQVLGVNARGVFLMIKESMPLLRAATGDRAVVNVASLAGQVGGISTSVHYAAAKAAVLAVTRSFARHLAPEGIRVNAVAPGPVATGITAQLADDARAALVGGVPLRRMGEPGEVAHAIRLLASADSGFTTGATYDINGGLRME